MEGGAAVSNCYGMMNSSVSIVNSCRYDGKGHKGGLEDAREGTSPEVMV